MYRYKDDVYDRIWLPYESSDWRRLTTSLSNDELHQNTYKPPAIVMSTAVTPINDSAPLQFQWDADDVNDQYYIYRHFNEVEELAENETRAFYMIVSADNWYGPVTPQFEVTNTIFSTKPLTGATRYQVSLSKTKNSTLPPIINAIEIYKVKDFSQLETEQDDGKLAL
jgi:hypothetical protein